MPDGSTLMAKAARQDSGARSGAARGDDIVLGAIAGAHGVRGLVKVKSFTEVPEDIFSFGPVRMGATGKEVALTPKGKAKNLLLVAIEGVDDRNGADAVRGLELSVPRDRLPTLQADGDGEDFYVADLIGLNAVAPTGQALGTVVAVHDFGAGDMLEIAPEGIGRGERGTDYVPFTRDAVPEVDLDAGRVVIEALVEFVASNRADDAEGGVDE